MRISDWSSDVCSSDLLAEGLQKYGLYYTLAGAATNISLNFLFIPRYGAVGAAWATLATQIGILPIQLAFRRGRGNFFMMLNAVAAPRSEEHTSELQSLMRISYAVFCLKKKKTTI